MRIPHIEAEIAKAVAEPAWEQSAKFTGYFKDLTNRFFSLYATLDDHPYVQRAQPDGYKSLQGFNLVTDDAAVRRITDLHAAAFDSVNDPASFGNPAIEAYMIIRTHPRDAIEAETHLRRAAVWSDGSFGTADTLGEPLDSFWESIKYPWADPINFTGDIGEYNDRNKSGELVTTMLIPAFASLEAQFDSMHGVLDIIEHTPRKP